MRLIVVLHGSDQSVSTARLCPTLGDAPSDARPSPSGAHTPLPHDMRLAVHRQLYRPRLARSLGGFSGSPVAVMRSFDRIVRAADSLAQACVTGQATEAATERFHFEYRACARLIGDAQTVRARRSRADQRSERQVMNSMSFTLAAPAARRRTTRLARAQDPKHCCRDADCGS